MNPQINTPELRAISSLLGQEICRPLDILQAGLLRLLAEVEQPATTTDRAHATTMLELCDDLRRLTWECLGSDEPPSLVPATATGSNQATPMVSPSAV